MQAAFSLMLLSLFLAGMVSAQEDNDTIIAVEWKPIMTPPEMTIHAGDMITDYLQEMLTWNAEAYALLGNNTTNGLNYTLPIA